MSVCPTRSGLGSSPVRPPNIRLWLLWVLYRFGLLLCQYLQMKMKPTVHNKSIRLCFRIHLHERHLSPSTGCWSGPTIFLSPSLSLSDGESVRQTKELFHVLARPAAASRIFFSLNAASSVFFSLNIWVFRKSAKIAQLANDTNMMLTLW